MCWDQCWNRKSGESQESQSVLGSNNRVHLSALVSYIQLLISQEPQGIWESSPEEDSVHWTIKPRSQVTNSSKKTQGPGLLSPMLIQRFFSSSFFHWRYSLLNIQVLCKSLSSHYKALKVWIFHLLCLVTWAINSNSLNTVTYTRLFREQQVSSMPTMLASTSLLAAEARPLFYVKLPHF